MLRIPVTSSDIKSIGYDPDNLILEIEFLSGGTYRYFGIPPHLHKEFMHADSKGKFLHAFIKFSYRYQRV